MDNRRESFRHLFGPTHPLRAKLTAPNGAILEVKVMDLSLGGVRVLAGSGFAAQFGKWSAEFQDVGSGFNLLVLIEPIYDIEYPDGEFGFRFCYPTNSMRKGVVEKSIWEFLLQQQRNYQAE